MLDEAWSQSTESDYDAIMNEINDELKSPRGRNELSVIQSLNKQTTVDSWGPDMIRPFLAAFQRVRGILVSFKLFSFFSRPQFRLRTRSLPKVLPDK